MNQHKIALETALPPEQQVEVDRMDAEIAGLHTRCTYIEASTLYVLSNAVELKGSERRET